MVEKKKAPRVPKHVTDMDKAVAKLLKDIEKGQIVKKEYLQALELAIKWAGTRSRIITRKTAGAMFSDVGGGGDPPEGGDDVGREPDPGGETGPDVGDEAESGDAGDEGS